MTPYVLNWVAEQLAIRHKQQEGKTIVPYRTISISVILHALAIAHRTFLTDGETLVFVSRSCPFAKDEPDALRIWAQVKRELVGAYQKK